MELEMQERLLQECMSSPIIKHLYEDRLDSSQFENFQSFESMVNGDIGASLNDDYADLRHKLLKEICLDIACKNGLTTLVKELLLLGTNTNRVNKKDNHAPIHFATGGGHVDTLGVLLAEPTNLNLQGTAQYETALHIAVKRNDECCARLLLKKGASATILDSNGLSAISLAARNKQRNMVKLILKEHWQFLNLDNGKNQTTRELINQNLPELQSMSQNHLLFHIYCDLQYFLKVSDEPNFLKHKIQYIDQCSLSITMKLLEIATQNNLLEAVIAILDWLKKKSKDLEENVKPAAHMAVQKGRHVILRKLIEVVPLLINDLIMKASLQLESKITRPRPSDWLKCMTMMLDQAGVNIRDLKDSKSNTPLYYAAKSGHNEVITLFLKKDCYIGRMKNNKPVLAHISQTTLEKYFVDCSRIMDDWTAKCTIEFNYRCLKPCNISPSSYDLMKNREMTLFQNLVHSKTHKELIKHPLLSSFLYLKWHKIQYFLLANFVLYMFFYFTLNSYIFIIMGHICVVNKNGTQLTNNENSNSTNLNCTTNNSKSPISQNTYHYILCPIISIWLIFLIFGEILQFICNCRYYIKDWTNGLQIMLFGLNVAFLCSPGISTGIAVTLLSSWKITIMISQYLRFSISIMIFRTVLYNFVCLFSPYIFLIVVFSMLFHIFYGESDLNPNPVLAYIKTVITLASNLSVISDNIISDSRYSTWFRLALVIFVILMVIIFTNILSGLTLIDLNDIQKQAELIELSHRIQLIANFENYACMIGRLMNRYFSSQIYDSFVNTILLFRNYLRDDKIMFSIHDTENFGEESGLSEGVSLFRNQDYYSSHNKCNVLPLAYIPKGMLATYFNDCVKKREKPVEIIKCMAMEKLSFTVDDSSLYNRVTDYDNYSDNSNDSDISRSSRMYNIQVKRPLRPMSPVLHIFELSETHEHSTRYRYWYTKFVLYMVFYLILNSYVLIMRYNNSSIKNETQLANNIILNNTTDKWNSPTQIQNILRINIAILLLFLIFRDVFRFVRKPRRYTKNWMNGLQIMLIELTIALLYDGKIQTGIVVILLATWKFMIIISKYPKSNVIFKRVIHNLQLYVPLFSSYIFPIAFSITFYIFYKDSDDKVFSHPTYATIKTIIILIGDFVIDKTKFDLHYMWALLVFVIFVFLFLWFLFFYGLIFIILMVIMLMNNLKVLKVSDFLRQIIQLKLNKFIYRIQVIAYFENIIWMISGLINHYFFKNLY